MVLLGKGKKVNLNKGFQEVVVNLNWASRGTDLDLGCLVELEDGRKGSVQALGNSFGSLKCRITLNILSSVWNRMAERTGHAVRQTRAAVPF